MNRKRAMNADSNDFGGGAGGGGGGKRSRNYGYDDALAEGKYELRILIPSKGAGAVIGKGGSFIKEIRHRFDATVTIPDTTTPERVLTIVCSQEILGDCFYELYYKLSEDQREGEGDLRMLVHQSHAGALIGRGGSQINELRTQTHSNLKIFQECCPRSTDRILLITVDQTRMTDVVMKIVAFLKEIPIKGAQRPYDASAYDSHVSYGGFADNGRGGGGGRGGGSHHRSGGGGGRGPPRSMDAGAPPYYDSYHGGAPPPSSYDHGAPSPYEHDQAGWMGGGGGGGPYRQPHGDFSLSPREEITTTQVSIPNELGGTVIGKGGERINRVRTDSGAKIKIGTPDDHDERVITITGTPRQIQIAQHLLQQCVRSSEAGRKYLRDER